MAPNSAIAEGQCARLLLRRMLVALCLAERACVYAPRKHGYTRVYTYCLTRENMSAAYAGSRMARGGSNDNVLPMRAARVLEYLGNATITQCTFDISSERLPGTLSGQPFSVP